jgi:hypothetical protein
MKALTFRTYSPDFATLKGLPLIAIGGAFRKMDFSTAVAMAGEMWHRTPWKQSNNAPMGKSIVGER